MREQLVDVESAVQPQPAARVQHSGDVEQPENVTRRCRDLQAILGAQLQGRAPVLHRCFECGVSVPNGLRHPGRSRAEYQHRVIVGSGSLAGRARSGRDRLVEVQHRHQLGQQRLVTDLPGQVIAAGIIAELATNTLALDQRLSDLDTQIAAMFDEHPQAAIIASMPGFGPILGASLLVAAGDVRAFPSAGHLAAAAGLVTVPNDSGRRTGNLHKPRRYSRPLRRVFYLSAQTSMMRDEPNRDYYLKKRDHGRTHTQAVIALARRRIDVLWALLRDERTYTATPPALAQAA
jgi:hypothetical protein